MLRVLIPFFIATLWITAGTAGAATKELTRAVFAAIPWDENEPNAEARMRFAEAIEAYWVNFDARIPRLSPKEQEWVKEEIAAGGERIKRAVNSKEYAIGSLNRHTDLCLDSIHNVIDSFETEQSQKVEMFYWVKMINCYDGTNDLAVDLDRAGIPNNDGIDQHILTPMSNMVQQTIVNKVIPMAMGKTMGWSFEE